MIPNNTQFSNPIFGRILTAMVTPFKENGGVDYELAIKLANHLCENGSDGIVLCGTTGESPTLSWDEQHNLFVAVKSSLNSRSKVIVGTGSNCTSEAIEATKKAYEFGADGALVVVPYYNKPPQEGLYNHFSSIATAASDLPLMLYNIPGRTGCNLLPTTVNKLMNFPNILSIKAASGRIEEVTELRAACGPKLFIYSGDDSLLLPMLSVGAVGVVSVASHIVGLQLKMMIESFQKGEFSIALDIHEKLQPLFKALFETTNPIPIKAALELTGWQVGSPRNPLTPLIKEKKDNLFQIIQNLSL
ncbi:Dihydrodipicolinate synthetase [Prochlorococcus marinus str. MIT 9515]|uniref:4-hydroxy-tetrahydrodipicolinate synthase n=1 Tax=Prochlorococcus marinus (strain MIT 9515) TaxID=167542 RepID=DAPA_PROM5|nr:4-hydroxy-tetrahydrodipicolinate synthase [Prochlorococcus marinus]A2BZ39.1 RecName: Full=4-hydroxy-tetrahydrodipicolinate synthase; Short=HTPA synthase [Prochlorococcus marinus str. MIT 9515]ABM73050.1 Dihydrodipicolinate synthetase [Prochlorococcus marinus str. MIT 9515]